ncbi:MAG: GDP-mannose 4,6-dehydratase [Bdellovibrionota bacterium]
MKVLFTGGQGFIGKHVSDRFKEIGHEVFLFEGDILNSSQLFKCLSAQNYDFIVHLAGISSVPQGESDLEKLFAVNQFGTSLLLEGIKAHCPNTHLIFSSSAQVYDSQQVTTPLSESSKVSPLNAYARSKYTSELLIESYSQLYQVTSTVFRIFNHTHKTHHREFFLPSIYERCVQAKSQGLKTQEISVGNLDLIRDISPVQRIRDIFSKYVAAKHDKGSSKIFNICSGVGLNLKVLAHELGNAIGVDIKFQPDPARFRKNDPSFFVGNNAKIVSFLDMHWDDTMNEKYLVKKFLEDI